MELISWRPHSSLERERKICRRLFAYSIKGELQKNKKNKTHVRYIMHWNRWTIHVISRDVYAVSSYYKVYAPSLSSSSSRVTLFFNLSLWTGSRQKYPFKKQQILHHALCGFPHHLSSIPFFKEAAELKSINNVNRGFKTHFPLNLLIYKLKIIASLPPVPKTGL